MIRKCDGTDPNLDDGKGNPCNCSAEFDDMYHLVIFPHERFIPIRQMVEACREVEAEPGDAAKVIE